MSDHEFEKKVEQKMDELRLRPSDAVWAEVERNLRRDKRRRRTLLWLPLLGILLTAGGYFIFKMPGNPGDTAQLNKQASKKAATPSVSTTSLPAPASATTSPNSSSSKNNSDPSTQNSTPANNEPVKKEPASEIDNTAAAKNYNVVSINKKKPGNNLQAGVKKQQPGKKINAQKTGEDEMIINNDRAVKERSKNNSKDKLPVEQETKTKDKLPVVTKVDSNAIVNNDNNDATDVGNNAVIQNTIDSSVKAIASGDSLAKKLVAEVAAKLPAKKKQSTESKWQWGVTANAGVANISEGNLFELLRAVRVDDLTGAMPSYNGIPPTPTPEPSPIRPGMALSAGAFVQRKLSKRISLSVGLQYSYFTVNTRVGKKVDSVLAVNYGTLNSQLAGSYYRSDNMREDYVNRYHFIEMPVTAGIRLTNSKKLPIMLDMGVSLSRLLNTNALHFDGIGRVYYENDDFFNKLQVGLNGSLNIGLFQNSKRPIWVGPNLRYFATGLVKKEVTTGEGQHIWTFGLNAKMLLKK